MLDQILYYQLSIFYIAAGADTIVDGILAIRVQGVQIDLVLVQELNYVQMTSASCHVQGRSFCIFVFFIYIQ